MASGDHGARKGRPSDRFVIVPARLIQQRLHINRQSQLREAHGHVGDTCNTYRPLAHEKLNEALFERVEEVAEHVYVAPVLNGGDFNPWNGDNCYDARLGRRFVSTVVVS
jgi:hypothetical protein